jgi:hypothetical protein
MFVTYTPEDDEGQTWRHIPHEMRAREQDLVETHAGTSFAQWTLDVLQGNAKARRVLLWLLLRREHPRVKLADVDFAWSELVVQQSRQELEVLTSRLGDTDDPKVPQMIERALTEIATAPDDPDAVPNRLPYVE